MTKTRSQRPTAGTRRAAAAATVTPAAATAERRQSKREIVLNLLRRPDGASTAELIDATGWQPHTVRAALSTLRKDGEVITRTGRGETMRYVLTEPR